MAAREDARELSLALSDINGIKKRTQDYDYIRFTWADLNGAQRGVTYTSRAAHRILDQGIPLFVGSLVLGPMSEIPAIPEISATKYGNCTMFADPATFHPVPWAGGKYRVAEVLCESYWLSDNTPQVACPRYACRKQLAKLLEHGYKLKSGFEIEFRLEDAETTKPIFENSDVFNHIAFGVKEEFLFECEKYLSDIDINVDKMHTEYAPGKFEIVLEPGEGIKVADDTFIAKQALKELAARQGMLANFMTKPDTHTLGIVMHFNHSLWTPDGRSAFFDDTDADHLSPVARHWIAGLLAHCKALTALCDPSVNCYRALHAPLFAHNINWGVEDRLATLRVRNRTPESTFIEDRLPGGVCNSYLVTAAHIAAGLDGLERQLECPPPNQSDAEELPHTLQDALEALAEDTILTKALGEELVAWFIQIKRQIDLTKLEDSDVKVNDPAAYRAEREMYAKYM